MYLGGTLACLDWLLRSMTPLAIDRNRVTYAASQQSALPPSFSRGSGGRRRQPRCSCSIDLPRRRPITRDSQPNDDIVRFDAYISLRTSRQYGVSGHVGDDATSRRTQVAISRRTVSPLLATQRPKRLTDGQSVSRGPPGY